MRICFSYRSGTGCRAENPDSAQFCRKCGRALRHSLHLLDPGTRVKYYRIVRTIGYGGFGAVYEAMVVQRPHVHIALKESLFPDTYGRFRAEFDILRGLQHDHLPRYYDIFEEQGNDYLVMEFVPGQSLLDVMKRYQRAVPETLVLMYAHQLCDVLSYLHKQPCPIIHNDIKPANVRITPEGLIKLVDFGSFKQLKDEMSTTRLFTPRYAPPEQISGKDTDARSDLYSLGATLYHLLSNHKPPFAEARLKHQQAGGADTLLLEPLHRAGVSPHIVQVIQTAMQLDRERRYKSAAIFKRALLSPFVTGVLDREDIVPANISTPPPRPVSASLLRTLRGHIFPVDSVAWNPDGTLLATASRDNTVLLWYVADGTLLYLLRAHAARVHSVSWSPDGKLLASASADSTVCLWDTSDGTVYRKLEGTGDDINSVAWSPDGQMVATGSGRPFVPRDTSVRLWDINDGRPYRTLEGHTRRVFSIIWSSDGQSLLSASDDATLRMWNASNGSLVRMLPHTRQMLHSVAWSPDGTLFAVGDTDRVGIWRLNEDMPYLTLRGHGGKVNTLAWSPDARTFASGSDDGNVYLWRGEKLLSVLTGHVGSVTSITWSPDGNMLASGSDDCSVRLWQIEYD